jgi:4-azaleucine resistance transporter AzlC
MGPHPFREGAKAASPIVLGYLPVGVAFGVLAQRAGLSPLEAGLMSLLVYAGSSQFVAVEMVSKGALWFPIVLATFFINLRHILMSSKLFLYLNRQPLRMLALLSAQLTDESFAVAMAYPSKIANRPRYILGIQITSQLAWIIGSVGGALLGSFIDHNRYGLPFALPSLFICLLVLQIRTSMDVWMMVAAGVSSLFFRWIFPGSWYIILAALLTFGVGMALDASGKRRAEE